MSWRTFFQGSLMALGVCASAQVMALSGLVLGSFSLQDNADARRAEVEFVMREPVRVVAARQMGGSSTEWLLPLMVSVWNNCGRERSPQGWDAAGVSNYPQPSLKMCEKLSGVWRRNPRVWPSKKRALCPSSPSQDRTVACS